MQTQSEAKGMIQVATLSEAKDVTKPATLSQDVLVIFTHQQHVLEHTSLSPPLHTASAQQYHLTGIHPCLDFQHSQHVVLVTTIAELGTTAAAATGVRHSPYSPPSIHSSTHNPGCLAQLQQPTHLQILQAPRHHTVSAACVSVHQSWPATVPASMSASVVHEQHQCLQASTALPVHALAVNAAMVLRNTLISSCYASLDCL
jgi:hypothetical protein